MICWEFYLAIKQVLPIINTAHIFNLLITKDINKVYKKIKIPIKIMNGKKKTRPNKMEQVKETNYQN